MAQLKKLIEIYLEMSDKVEPIVTEVFNNSKFMEDIPEGSEKELIQWKIKILKNKEEYLKKKTVLEAAVKDYIEKKLSEQKTTIQEIAEIHGIGIKTLENEIKRYRSEEKYRYDKKINQNHTGFSYHQEELLLEELDLHLINKKLLSCSCRICFLLQLSTFAYEFAKKHNISYPRIWDTCTSADLKWLKEFEMRHSSRISSRNKKCIL